jgi:hypothetical protein
MLGRFALAGAILLVGVPAGFAAPIIPLQAVRACTQVGGARQCAIQVNVNGTDDNAYTYMRQDRDGLQLGVTFQTGQNNLAYTNLNGTNQASLTVQTGNDNGGFTYQSGSRQISTTAETGNGGWAASSSIGHGSATSVSLSSN